MDFAPAPVSRSSSQKLLSRKEAQKAQTVRGRSTRSLFVFFVPFRGVSFALVVFRVI
jgi:hypothetical protein